MLSKLLHHYCTIPKDEEDFTSTESVHRIYTFLVLCFLCYCVPKIYMTVSFMPRKLLRVPVILMQKDSLTVIIKFKSTKFRYRMFNDSMLFESSEEIFSLFSTLLV